MQANVLRTFVDACVAIRRDTGRSAAEQQQAVAALMRVLIADVPALQAALPRIEHDETLIHASPELFIVHLRLTPNVLYPPHEHRMRVVVGAYEGEELNSFFARSGAGARLRRTRQRRLRAGEVLCFEPAARPHGMSRPAGASRLVSPRLRGRVETCFT